MILAGGASSRMGRDKLLLEVGGMPLVRRVHGVLSAVCEEVLVSGPRAIPGVEARHVPDLRADYRGPLAGIEAGLSAARYPLVLVAAGDMPFLTAALVEYLLERISGEGLQAVIPLHDGRPQPLCAAYNREIVPQVKRALDEDVLAMRKFLNRLESVKYVEELRRFGEPDLLLMNVNTPQDLERARSALGNSERR